LAVQEQVAMQGKRVARVCGVWEERLEDGMSLVGIHLLVNETEADADAVNVGIHWQHRAMAGKEEHAGRRLRPHPSEALQPRVGLIKGHFVEKREVKIAAFLPYLLQDGFDAVGFLV